MLFLLAFIIVILSVVIIAVGFYYSKLVIKLNHIQKENLYLRYHVQEKSLQKINNAKDRSTQIIADAAKQAEEILKNAEVLKTQISDESKQEFIGLAKRQSEALRNAAEELHKAFNQSMQEVRDEDINLFKNTTKDIENITVQEIKSFEDKLHQETIGKEQLVEQKVNEAFSKAQSEIEVYKQNKLAEVDRKIFTVLEKATREVLRKTLNLDDHRELILAAVKKAKSELPAA